MEALYFTWPRLMLYDKCVGLGKLSTDYCGEYGLQAKTVLLREFVRRPGRPGLRLGLLGSAPGRSRATRGQWRRRSHGAMAAYDDSTASDEDADAFVLDDEGEELQAQSPRRPRSAARSRPASSSQQRARRPGSALSTGTDDFIVEEDGSDVDDDALETQHPHGMLAGSGGIAGRDPRRPSTAGPAHSRLLGTIARRPASALGDRGSKARPASAASLAESEASAASGASTQIAAASRPVSAFSSRPQSALSRRPTSALSSRPHSALSCALPQHQSGDNACPGSDFQRDAVMPARESKLRPQSASSDVQRDAGAPARMQQMQRPATASAASRSSAATAGVLPTGHHGVGVVKWPRPLWEWPKLTEMRKSAFEDDPAMRDADDVERVAPEILGQELGIDLVKDDGRHYQFLQTLDEVLKKTRADIDALRLPKVELETKLGLLHNTVAALPDPEAVKAELEELSEERKRKEHLFKTDMTMTRVLDVLSQVVIAHKAKQRYYEYNLKSRQDLVRVRDELAVLQKKQGLLWQRLEGLVALRQRIVDEQHARARGPSHIISARPGGPRCSVRCLSAPVRRIVPRGAHDAARQASSVRCFYTPNSAEARASSVRREGGALCKRIENEQAAGVGGERATDGDPTREQQERVANRRENIDVSSQSPVDQSAGCDRSGTAEFSSKFASMPGDGFDVSGYQGPFVKDGWLFKRELNQVVHCVACAWWALRPWPNVHGAGGAPRQAQVLFACRGTGIPAHSCLQHVVSLSPVLLPSHFCLSVSHEQVTQLFDWRRRFLTLGAHSLTLQVTVLSCITFDLLCFAVTYTHGNKADMKISNTHEYS